MLGAISELLDYVSQDPLRHALLRPSGEASRESLGTKLRLRRWGRGDVELRERLITHFLPGLGAELPCGGFESRLLTLAAGP